MRMGAFVALAAACKVSLDWLATGIGSENPEWFIPEPPASPDSGLITETGPMMPFKTQSQSQNSGNPEPPDALREVQGPMAPQPKPIDLDRLRQAMDIVKSLDGIKAFDAPNAAERVARAYDILTGAKP